MTDQGDMEQLSLRHDLEDAEHGLYYAARRYCAITEQGFWPLGGYDAAVERDLEFGRFHAAGQLAQAANRYEETHERWFAATVQE